MLLCLSAMHKDTELPSLPGMLLGLVKNHPDQPPGTSPVPSPHRLRQRDAARGGDDAGGGFLTAENQVRQRHGPPTPAKGHPMTATMGNPLHCLPALIGAVTSH